MILGGLFGDEYMLKRKKLGIIAIILRLMTNPVIRNPH